VEKKITDSNGIIKNKVFIERLPHYQYVDVLQENGSYNRFMAKPYLELAAESRTGN
jgi:hypothetical protein